MGVGDLPDEIERVARDVVDAALKVHRTFGPGLLESIYEVCLAQELAMRGRKVLRQVRVPIQYEGTILDVDFRLDLLIDDLVLVEVKAVDTLIPLHKAQCLTYLKLTHHRLCLLINFNVVMLKDGIKRIVH